MILRPPSSRLFSSSAFFLFFFNDTATTEIYTLSLHDALPISRELRFEGDGLLDTTPESEWTTPRAVVWADDDFIGFPGSPGHNGGDADVFVERFQDRKSTRLNSSHTVISYAVFCLKKNKTRTHRAHATEALFLDSSRSIYHHTPGSSSAGWVLSG